MPNTKVRKNFFTLTRKNQSGQVAIFVALIFQIVFIFFALLINVGLLVHHKINLQQSTDLAAYYGAMKQAEILNVISHVNFQIRQAWKLLTWRYRILGTFGMDMVNSGGSNQLQFPMRISNTNTPISYNPNSYQGPNSVCTTTGSANGMSFSQVPAFCIAHNAYTDWPGGTGFETYCKADCGHLQNASTTIPSIATTGGISVGLGTNGVAQAVNTAINITNQNLRELCTESTVIGISVLSRFIASYSTEMANKENAIKLLLTNLSSPRNLFYDLNKKLVFTGVKNTLENNLTEANKSSLNTSSIEVMNGVSTENSNVNKCNYDYSGSDSELVSNIVFQFIQFFQLACEFTGTLAAGSSQNAGTSNYKFVSIYNSTNDLHQIIRNELARRPAIQIDAIKNAIYSKMSLGFEKNPWCNVYYGVRASTEPKIPFLPISKIKLNAVAFAKPFGGAIGPLFYNNWKSDVAAANRNSGLESEQTDKNLPLRQIGALAANPTLAEFSKILPNFSNFVGDTKGLADVRYIAVYHDMLLSRNITRSDPALSDNKTSDVSPNRRFSKGSNWPKFSDWNNIAVDMSDPNYDPLPLDFSNPSSLKNSFIRDLEISAIAPNQFDLTYYSIDSDFYHNYYEKKLDDTTGAVSAMAAAHGVPSPYPVFRPDFGFSRSNIQGIPTDFSVRHQLGIVEKIFRPAQSVLGSDVPLDLYFTFIPKSPASLLTGWTFVNLTNAAGYSTFPAVATGTTMPFGNCKDAQDVNSNYESIAKNPALPPAPGNCVTGGRTGYSVKIVSQEAINGSQGDIGGPGTGGRSIRNPIPASFFNFQ